MKRLKYLADINPLIPQDRIPLSNDLVSFLPMEKIGEDGSLDLTEVRTAYEVSKGYTPILDGDLVIAKITPCFENGKGALCYNLQGGIGFGTTELIVLRAKPQSNSRFLYWLTQSYGFRKWGEAEMRGSAGQKRVTEEFVANFRTIGLSQTQQHRIAAYLDQQTAKIDRLINLRQRQIALLKEQRAALIQQAVTRGLNPDVPMKDSGLPWLGEIPAHWKVKKLKTLGRIRYGLGQPPRLKENGIPMLRATNVDSGQILTKDLLLVDPDQLPASRDPFLQMGDIIVVRSGALTGDSAIVPPEYYGAVIGYDMVLSVINAEPKFLAAALLTDYVRNQQLRLSMMRAAQPHLNAEELGGAIIVNPPIDEQKMIIEFIEQQNFKIDSLQTAYSRQITLLTEYRAALIHECVTGQRVIPDYFNTGG